MSGVERKCSRLHSIVHHSVQHTNSTCNDELFARIWPSFNKSLIATVKGNPTTLTTLLYHWLTYAGIVSDPDPTDSVVRHRRYFSSAPRAVLVVPVVLQTERVQHYLGLALFFGHLGHRILVAVVDVC